MLTLSGVLASCGGGGGSGGGSSTPAATTADYALSRAYTNYVNEGQSINFSVSGNCSGTGTLTIGIPALTAFLAASAYGSTETLTLNTNACSLTSNTRTLYYNSTPAQIGFSIQNGEFGVAQAPIALPGQVAVGDSGTLGTFNVWTDSTQTVSAGTLVFTYSVMADTSTSAIVQVTKDSYNTSMVLTQSQIEDYRITSSGTLTLVSINYQVAGILLTAN